MAVHAGSVPIRSIRDDPRPIVDVGPGEKIDSATPSFHRHSANTRLKQVTPPSTFANSDTATVSTSPAHGSTAGTSTSADDGSGETSIHSRFTSNRPSGSALHAVLRCRHSSTGTPITAYPERSTM